MLVYIYTVQSDVKSIMIRARTTNEGGTRFTCILKIVYLQICEKAHC